MTKDSLVYPDMWPCKYPRIAGGIAQDCAWPDCDCAPLTEDERKEAREAMDSDKVIYLPILPKYEP